MPDCYIFAFRNDNEARLNTGTVVKYLPESNFLGVLTYYVLIENVWKKNIAIN